MKKFYLIIILLFLLISVFLGVTLATKCKYNINNQIGQNEQEYPIDIELKNCVSKNYFTVGMNNCAEEAIKAWENEADLYCAKIEKTLEKEKLELFIADKKAWEKYYAAESDFLNNTVATLPGDIHTTFVMGYL